MDILDTYNIPYKGLSNGSHRFDFEIGDAFFRAFDDSVVKGGSLRVEVELDKAASMLLLGMRIAGEVTVECDRCLADLSLPVDYEGTLTVKFSDEIEEYDGDILWIHPSQGEVPLAQYLYESVVLGLPYQRVHGTDTQGNLLCDKDMLSRFRIVSLEEFDTFDTDARSLAQNGDSEKLQQLRNRLEEEERK